MAPQPPPRPRDQHLRALPLPTRPDDFAPESPQIQAALAEAEIVRTQTSALNSLSTREQRLHKIFLSTLEKLEARQSARKALAATQMQNAIILSNHHKQNKIPFEPSEFGFVLSNDDISNCLWRSTALRDAKTFNEDLLQRQQSAAAPAEQLKMR